MLNETIRFQVPSLIAFLGMCLFVPVSWGSAPKKRAIKRVNTGKVSKRTTTRFVYAMYFNKKKGGISDRKQIRRKDGSIIVYNKTSFQFRYWFFKIVGVNNATLHYDKNGQLLKFRKYAKVRGNVTRTWGTQNAKGFTIYVKKSGKTTKKFIPRSLYDVTDFDLRLKMQAPGSMYLRRQLIVEERKIIRQKYAFSKAGTSRWLGKSWKVWKVSFSGKRGKDHYWMTSGGWMLRCQLKVRIGSMGLKLVKATSS